MYCPWDLKTAALHSDKLWLLLPKTNFPFFLNGNFNSVLFIHGVPARTQSSPELQASPVFSYKFHSDTELNSFLTRYILSVPDRDLEVKTPDLFHFNSVMMHLITNTPKWKGNLSFCPDWATLLSWHSWIHNVGRRLDD